MKAELQEEVTKIVRPAQVVVTMSEDDAHDLMDFIQRRGSPKGNTAIKLYDALDKEIGQR